jgi:hypothetical protein
MSSSIEGSTYGPNTGFAANTTGQTLIFVLGSVTVPFPSAQNLGDSITVNGANTVFTVVTPGRYRISYGINTTAAAVVTSQVLVNGVANPGLTFTPILSVSRYAAEAIVTLPANATISVTLTGVLGSIILTGGQGAGLTIQRVQ